MSSLSVKFTGLRDFSHKFDDLKDFATLRKVITKSISPGTGYRLETAAGDTVDDDGDWNEVVYDAENFGARGAPVVLKIIADRKRTRTDLSQQSARKRQAVGGYPQKAPAGRFQNKSESQNQRGADNQNRGTNFSNRQQNYNQQNRNNQQNSFGQRGSNTNQSNGFNQQNYQPNNQQQNAYNQPYSYNQQSNQPSRSPKSNNWQQQQTGYYNKPNNFGPQNSPRSRAPQRSSLFLNNRKQTGNNKPSTFNQRPTRSSPKSNNYGAPDPQPSGHEQTNDPQQNVYNEQNQQPYAKGYQNEGSQHMTEKQDGNQTWGNQSQQVPSEQQQPNAGNLNNQGKYDNKQAPPSKPFENRRDNQRNFDQSRNQRKQWQKSTSPTSLYMQKPSYDQTTKQERPASARVQQDNSVMAEFGGMSAASNSYVAQEKKKFRNAPPPPEHAKADTNPYRLQNALTVWGGIGETIPDPIVSFGALQLRPFLMNAFRQAGFTAPTPIQAQTWPVAFGGRDVISIAKTGSGKTLAFLIPGYKKIDAVGGDGGRIRVLVIAPTRELAQQIQQESQRFGGRQYRSVCAYGGAPKREQLAQLRQGCAVLVGTPGRLNDFLSWQQINLSVVTYFVMDEADRMLDMGFEPQIRDIVKKLPRQRQTLMFSATWPEEVRRMASDFLKRPIHIRFGSVNELNAADEITQNLILLNDGSEKDDRLLGLLRNFQRTDLVLIFAARKRGCDFVANMLQRCGFKAKAIHSDKSQDQRESILDEFRTGRVPIMVATDVASRGLDVKGIRAVINYDMANAAEDYVHRIGRTGRAGVQGASYTFVTRSGEDAWKIVSIVEIMQKANQFIPPDIAQIVERHHERQRRNQLRNQQQSHLTRVIMVAEKPSVAQKIAEHLSNGRFRKRRGKSRAMQIYEFISWFAPAGERCQIVVTSVVGHVYNLDFKQNRVRDIADLFDSQTVKEVGDMTKKLMVVEHLQDIAKDCEYMALWLDCDMEGENIGFEVISLCQQWIHYDNVYRARFSALTQQELTHAFRNLARPDKYAALAVDARQELDLKIGCTFTRLMTRRYIQLAREKYRIRDQKCISYGPCQTPTLWFCVQRHKEIKAFRPEPYWEVGINVQIQRRTVLFKAPDRITDQQIVHRMEQAIRSGRQSAMVEGVLEEQKTFNKPIGLNTVQLLKACSTGLGMSPTEAMKIAEKLYTSGFISYPRTETSKYNSTFDLHAVLQEHRNHPNWGKTVGFLLATGNFRAPERGRDIGDHPPITPMKCAGREEFTGKRAKEWKIYNYVSRHFIGSLMQDFQYIERTATVQLGGYPFQFKWHQVTERGFCYVMPWKANRYDLNEIEWHMPMLHQGTQLPVLGVDSKTLYTKSPDYLKESELIELMDKRGIGTDASIPQHIKNVCDRNYVVVCGPGENGQRGEIIRKPVWRGKNWRGRGGRGRGQQRPASRHMVPRPLGLAFLSCFEELDNELCEPGIRAYMEQQVKKIATGETEKNEVVRYNLDIFHKKFLSYRSRIEQLDRFFLIRGKNQTVGGRGGGRGGGYNRNNRGGGRGGNRGNGYNRGRGNNRGRGWGTSSRGSQDSGRGGYRGGRGGDSGYRGAHGGFRGGRGRGGW